MKSTEFLKDIIDLFNRHTDIDDQDAATDSADSEDVGVFIPPLQQKIELLKRAVGVDNIYTDEPELISGEDYEEESTDQNCDCDPTSQLQDIKRIAGINPVVLDSLSDDGPLEV